MPATHPPRPHPTGTRPTGTHPPRAARTGRAVTAAALLLATGLAAPVAHADTPPGLTEDTTPPVAIDARDPDLRMVQGATLAPSKVLNIKSVVETDDGAERRQDTNDNVTFALQAEVLFGKDSAELTDDARSRIAAIADEVTKQHAKKLRVFGFTDDLGSAAHGVTLSRERAGAVQRRLAEDLGSAVTFEIRGYGEQYPIADNSTEEGRKKNRRVEVSFPRED
ncbi:OmpA family protein [Streptomyces sp. NBC_01525]|uniref:OmpA family protein n=1 Tax=Streptomyces sp. NBC_01525 TaxID=2903893 RepID=UPI00386BA849